MYDFRACLDLIKAVSKASHEKAIHEAIRPCLADKQAMADYAKATGNTGKAVFIEEQQSNLVEWSV